MSITDEANILRLHPLGESDVIVVADTALHGILHAVAKGARKPRSIYSGKLDLFFKVSLTWTPSRKSSLSTLKDIQLLNTRENIRKGYSKMLMGAYFTKLFEKGIEPGSPAPEFHSLLERALNYLDSKTPDLKGLLHFEKELTSLHGITSPYETPQESLKRFLGKLPPQRDSVLKYLDSSGNS